jgi:hypothetical protein
MSAVVCFRVAAMEQASHSLYYLQDTALVLDPDSKHTEGGLKVVQDASRTEGVGQRCHRAPGFETTPWQHLSQQSAVYPSEVAARPSTLSVRVGIGGSVGVVVGQDLQPARVVLPAGQCGGVESLQQLTARAAANTLSQSRFESVVHCGVHYASCSISRQVLRLKHIF